MIDTARKEALIRTITRVTAYQTIQNVMGRAVASFNFREADALLSHFALTEPDVSVEIADEGVFEGREAVEMIVRETVGAEPKVGEMIDVQLTTPIIEVAGDGKTARGVWWSPGAASILESPDADPRALWMWGDLAVDFLLTDDGWKIWHLHYFRVIKCDYHAGWVEDTSRIHRPNTAMHPLSKPTTWHNPYSPKSVRMGIPAAPFPYETWQNDNWMLRSDKTL